MSHAVLLTASHFGVLAATTIGSTGTTSVTGRVAVSPGKFPILDQVQVETTSDLSNYEGRLFQVALGDLAVRSSCLSTALCSNHRAFPMTLRVSHAQFLHSAYPHCILLETLAWSLFDYDMVVHFRISCTFGLWMISCASFAF